MATFSILIHSFFGSNCFILFVCYRYDLYRWNLPFQCTVLHVLTNIHMCDHHHTQDREHFHATNSLVPPGSQSSLSALAPGSHWYIFFPCRLASYRASGKWNYAVCSLGTCFHLAQSSQPRHCWPWSHIILCCGVCAVNDSIFSSIPGLYPLDSSSMSFPNCHHQTCIQTSPNVPWGGKISLLRTTD